MRSAASNSPASGGRARRGDTLVECLVALALAGAVFPASSAALRAAVRRDADTTARLAAAAALRPAALSAAAALRLGAEEPAADRALGPAAVLRVREAPFAGDLPPDLPPARAIQAEAPGAALALLPFPPPTPSDR